MKHQTITKTSHKVSPNLPNYEKAYSSFDWEEAKKEVSYFKDGTLNAAHNALDKWKGTETEDKTALIFIDADDKEHIFSYGNLIAQTNQFANALQSIGVEKTDRVFMFLPRVPELYISFLGTLKIGAIAGNLFAAFGKEALEDRLKDSKAKVLITTNELLERVNEIADNLPDLEYIVVVGNSEKDYKLKTTNYKLFNYQQLVTSQPESFECTHLDEDSPSYMLYTSGTTGKPKGVIHAHGDIVQQHLTTKWILDIHPEDIYWCTADPGWVTGVVYGIIGPWSNGVTQIVHGGRFDPDTWYSIIEKYKVSIWYTAPTAIRMLMTGTSTKDGEPNLLKKHDLSSIRYMASVGEPLNPEAIIWGQKHLNLPIHDNYWQTETGSIVIANYPSMDIKPGSMGKPFPGIEAAIIDAEGKELEPGQEGDIALRGLSSRSEQSGAEGWPSRMKMIWGNEEKFKSYFRKSSASSDSSASFLWYITGDKGMKDKDGYFWFVGRDDDVIKTAGERVGPFEVESALVAHPAIAEAGVIGKPDEVRGAIIKAFIKLNRGHEGTDDLKEEIQAFTKKQLAGHAYPREIEFVDKLPKTRSGKIMRRVLKQRELGEEVGDTSTMEEY